MTLAMLISEPARAHGERRPFRDATVTVRALVGAGR